MGAVAQLRASLLIAALVAATSAFRAQEQHVPEQQDAAPVRSLFAQSAIQVLARDFPAPELSYLLFDAQSDVLLTSRWAHADQPIPLGSLVKPFTALAYAESHQFRYPSYSC